MSKTTYIFKCPYCGTDNSTDRIERNNDNFAPTVGVFCANYKCGRAFTVKFSNNFNDFSVSKMSHLDVLHNLVSAYEIQRLSAGKGDFSMVVHQEQAIRQLMREATTMLVEDGRLEIVKE